MSVLWNIGVAYIDLTDMGEVERTAARLRAAEPVEADTLGVACADLLQCNVAIVRGEFVSARALAELALDVAMRLGSTVDAAEMHERLAEISCLEGDLDAVDHQLVQVSEYRRDMDQDHQWRANLVRTRRALALGDLPAWWPRLAQRRPSD